MRQQFQITIPLDLTLTTNRTIEVWRKQRTKDAMKALTKVHARHLAPCGKATINIGIVKRTAGAYDPQNLQPTFKGCIDQLVTMGVLDEDDHHHVLGPLLYHHEVDRQLPPKHLRAVVTLTEYAPIPAGVSV